MTKVLIVDDSAMDRRLSGGLLKKYVGLHPIYAQNGREALSSIPQDVPDIVVTDLQMPEMDGLELVETIRKHYPSLPVILMTAHGSEEIAVKALQKGAASEVLEVAQAHQKQKLVLECLVQTESRFVIVNDVSAIAPLVGQLENNLKRMGLCDDTGLIQVAVALREALVNAIFHGNLEVSSELLSIDPPAYDALVEERRGRSPYRDRRVHITARETRTEATYVITDEGPGFDPTNLPDPLDPANLEKPSGRGLMLIRTFMDEVIHNERGNQITMVKRKDSAPPEEDTTMS
jgi:CheY-like chemotaxis protein